MDKRALASALRIAETEHAKYEATLGRRDDNWADWYADYIVRNSLTDCNDAVRENFAATRMT